MQYRAWSFAVAVSLAASMGRPARADDARRTSTAAEALFVEGRALLQERRFAEACVKLAQSAEIDPAAGTLLNLAYCHEASGQTASAWSAYMDAASAAAAAGQRARVAAAQQKARDLEPRLARLRFAIAPALALQGAFEVRRDDVRLTPGELESAVPVDAGRHVIEVRLAGYVPWSRALDVRDGDGTLTVPLAALVRAERPPGNDAAVAVSGTPAALARASADVPVTATAKDAPSVSPLRAVGVAAGITGVVAAGIGGYFGLRAIALDGDARRVCGAPGPCADAEGVRAGESANRAATASTVLFAAGGALLLSGAALYLLAPRAHPSERAVGVHAAVTPDGVALRAQGVF